MFTRFHPQLKRWLLPCLGLLGALLLLPVGLYFSSSLLVVEHAVRSADAIVILGGDSALRPKRSLKILHQLSEIPSPLRTGERAVPPSEPGEVPPRSLNSTPSAASQSGTGVPPASVPSLFAPPASPHSSTPPFFVVSGNGDCKTMAHALSSAGVPTNAIVLECASRSTWQNAAFSIPLLREHHATNVIIVTSWFHSRRALRCFQKQAPDLQFISLPTIEDRPLSHWPNQYDRSRVLLEYAKTLVYWLRYGVAPF